MDLNSSLSIATSGLEGTQYALGVLSQNVSNASTTGYVEEVANLNSKDTTGTGSGVQIGLTTRNVNDALEAGLYTQNATVEALTVKDNSLSAITALQGSTSSDSGSSATLSDELGNVSNALTSLVSNPTDATAQATVISDAESLTSTVSTLSSAYQTQRQSAEDSIVTGVSSINTDLTTIGSISQQIMALKVQGASVADLENQRASVMSDLSSKLSVTFTETSKGDMLVKTDNGTQLPTEPDASSGIETPSSTWPLSTESITLSTASAYSASTSSTNGIPGIDLTINGTATDITSSLTGGSLGANIDLRDNVYPKMQAQLDSFSYALANRFQSSGLALFTSSANSMTFSGGTTLASDGSIATADSNTVTSTNITGLSSTLQVNPSFTDDTSLLAPDGSTTTVQKVLSTALGSASGDVSGDLAAPTSSGSIQVGYSGASSLSSLATTLTSTQAAVAATATSSLSTATSVQTSLSTKVSNVSGVNVDNEMSNMIALQNAYTANAKVVTVVQTMWTALLDAV
ncbi:flagellar hook-associated protein FlgK [Acetobacter fallax]|uniref:Flagellar hook-associated protein 1 n=1 Tax=Acetobacter fallax TaxID=1737473 RepID=A0ABX0KCU9_9PROT|nr:flagellar hook-associated protein FlgK [Acetobacter fallax]NHO33830.1 flagellar hook-associated protein FlgK [Acetobacter fallax]NHO37391.1 flagellar hook-associated protein FlgK [Acetobacter fallax]